MGNLQQLKEIIHQVGPEKIWRPIRVPGNGKLADGYGDQDRIDFQGKTVADIGCNFGYYVFLARRAGARHVTGIDIDARIIAGCRLLQKIYHLDGVSFLSADIKRLDGIGTFDTGMMIDFIGKEVVSSGFLNAFLDGLERLSQREMILSVRPAYHLAKHLNTSAVSLQRKYPGDYIRHNHFSTFDYVCDRFRRGWEMAVISAASLPSGTKKETLHFRRKNGSPA